MPISIRPTRSARGLGLALAALLAFCATPAHARIGRDKLLHFAVSTGLGASAATVFCTLSDDPPSLRLTLAGISALLPGLAKEIYDSGQPGNHFSGADLGFNLLGVLAGTATVALVGWLLNR